MKLVLTPDMTFESMSDCISSRFPEYKTTIKRNPIAKFQYIEVRKSGTVGIWIRVFEKKGYVMLINTMPSPLVRAFLGGLLLIAFTHKAQSKVRTEIGEALKEEYKTTDFKT